MGRIIANKVRGMNWKAKIALVLMFALVFSTFMHEGLLKPKKAEAAITYQSAGALAYSAAGGTTVAPAYPATPAAGDLFVMIIGMKPGTANTGAVTTPAGWTPIVSLTGAGGYGATLGADTGNTNLFTFYKVAAGGETGSLTVTVNVNGANGIAWAQMYRVSNTTKVWDVAGATGSDTTAGNVSIAFGSNPGVTLNDVILAAMCIPTDITTPTQFSAEAFTQTGVTFAAATEISEPDSLDGNDIGGFVARTTVTAGTGTANPTMTATAGGTTTNVRGPGVFIRIREGKYPNTITSCSGCHDYAPTFTDGTARNTPAGQFLGSHGPHVQNSVIACSVCHIAPATETSADFAHRTGTIQMQAGATGIRNGYYDKNNNSAYNAGVDDAFSVSNSPTLASCRNVNCHATGLPGATVPTPTWGTGPSNCTWCHGDPPTTSLLWNHQGVTAGVCASCHGHNGSGATHANGTLNGTYTCIGCHSGPLGTRSAITPEFGLAYGHKKSGRGAVTDADCIVCHLEGVFATGLRSATYHQNGNVDLRDPDGAGETPITNISGGAFTFTKFAISYAAGSRTSTGHTSNTDVANVITQKFCLACHDSNGATNTTARSNNGGTGTATMPFGGINLGANYTVLNGAAVAGGLINAKTQFATTNSSVHPVMGPRTKDFPTPARLNAPYNNFTRVGTSGTKTAGVVLNCFDCHTSGTALTTRTIAAHGSGGAAQVRGTFYVTSPSLCIACHAGYNVAPGSNSGHGAGSAGQWNGNNGEAALTRCMWCHSSTGLDTAAPARPRPAADYHGFNARADGTLWPTTNSKPYAFIRSWTGTAYHRPFRGIGELTTGSATCGNGTCPGNGQVGDGSNRTYTPGGSY